MTPLKHRIANVGTNQARAMGDYHPAGTGATPHVMPPPMEVPASAKFEPTPAATAGPPGADEALGIVAARGQLIGRVAIIGQQCPAVPEYGKYDPAGCGADRDCAHRCDFA